METMHFHMAETNLFLGQPLDIVLGWVQGRLNWMLGYKSVTPLKSVFKMNEKLEFALVGGVSQCHL